MPELVRKFLSKPSKTFRSGGKYGKGRKYRTTKDVLSEAFTGSSAGQGNDKKKIFKELLDYAYKTEMGKDILNKVSRLGYTFEFESGMDKGGCCHLGEKKITLSPECGFNHMLISLVHEGQHAIQGSLGNTEKEQYQYQLADFYKYDRALEADAVAHEVAFTSQLKDVYPPAYQERAGQGLPMLLAYENEMNISKDAGKAMSASFKAWYGNHHYLNFYDNLNKEFADYIIDGCTKEKDPAAFQKTISSQEILKMCRYGNKPYIEESFLETPQAFSIRQEDKTALSEKMKVYASEVEGAKPDNSLSRMYSRDKEGNIIRESHHKNLPVCAEKMLKIKQDVIR